MAAMTLGQLLVAPGIAVGSGDDPLSCLEPGESGLPDDHPVVEAARTSAKGGIPPWRVPLTAHVGFVNLGSHHRGRGLVACLAGEPDRAGAQPRLTWVAWGLSRPSVNLFLAPELAGLSTELKTPVTHDAVLELVSSKSFLESNIESTVRVEHVMEPLTYRIYPDTPVGEVQHLLLRRRIDAVPVVGEQHELLGLITADDVLRHILPSRDGGPPSGRRGLVARDLMTRSVLCVSEREDLGAASRSLISRRMSQLPVVVDGRLVGFLPAETVMRAFAEAYVTSRSPTRIDRASTP